VTTGMLHGCGIAVGLLFRRPVGAVIVRLTGAAIAVTGGYFLCPLLPHSA
jgi:hypothetical protein